VVFQRGSPGILKERILLRRPDGSLDHVFSLGGRINDLFGNPHRVIVPVRVRSASGTPAAYFTTEQRSTPTGRFSNVLNRAYPIWNFEPGEPPEKFALEIKEKGLWRPSR